MKTVSQQIIKLLSAILLITPLFSTAQVGIGTTTPNTDAELDIVSTTRGLLLPRVSLTNTTNPNPLSTDVAGMIVYNTATTGDVTPGFYYNDGALWVRLGTAGSADWSVTGNTGTTAGTNFIGTTDTEDFVVKTNNSERIRVASNGKVGIAENNPTDATLEVGGNLIIGNTFTGGTAVAQLGGVTIEGRTIIGEDDFFYGIDKVVVYGNTDWIPAAVTNGDNGNGLTYAINGYTSDGVGIYGEDNDGGIGVSANVSGSAANRPTGVSGFDISGNGTGVRGVSENATNTFGYIGLQGIESTLNGWAVFASGDVAATGSGYWNLSDKRLKRNIKPLKNALNILDNIKPKTYEMRWNEEKYKKAGLDRTPQMGFLAQELENILPYVVKEKTIPLNTHIYTKKEIQENPKLAKLEEETMDLKMVNYIQMIPLLTQAIKEQQEIIKSLKARVEKLEK